MAAHGQFRPRSAITSRETSEDFIPHGHGDAIGHRDGAEFARRAARRSKRLSSPPGPGA